MVRRRSEMLISAAQEELAEHAVKIALERLNEAAQCYEVGGMLLKAIAIRQGASAISAAVLP